MGIILSYSRKDEGVVKTLAQGLEAAKREVWFDHDLGGGDVWWDAILDKIRNSAVFLFALSDASLQSKPCRLELDYALALGRPILPVQVGPVSALRTTPLAELQIVDYSPEDARSGFTVLAAVDEAARRVRPLPDPLPAPPPIPFGYLQALGRQIDSTELSVEGQKAVVDQLRRALGEETDESVRQDILSMLKNLNSKPWTIKWAEKEIAALLLVYGPAAPAAEDRPDGQRERPDRAEPTEPQRPQRPAPAPPEPDPREWFAERLEQLQQQRAAVERTLDPDPPPWRPAPDVAAQWRQAYEGGGRPGAGAAAPGGEAAGQGPAPRPSYFAGPPAPQPGSGPFAGPAGAQPAGGSYWAAQPAPAQQQPATEPYAAPAGAQPAGGSYWAAQPAAAQQQPATPQAPAERPPPNYWAMSIVSFLLSVVFGGIAMYFSYQVGQRFGAGDLEGARRASRNAKIWGIVGIIAGGILILSVA